MSILLYGCLTGQKNGNFLLFLPEDYCLIFFMWNNLKITAQLFAEGSCEEKKKIGFDVDAKRWEENNTNVFFLSLIIFYRCNIKAKILMISGGKKPFEIINICFCALAEIRTLNGTKLKGLKGIFSEFIRACVTGSLFAFNQIQK